MSQLKFNTPRDILDKTTAVTPAAAASVTATPLLGIWKACDSATRGIVRVEISLQGSTMQVHVFGSCTPTPCDWKVVKGMAYASSVSGGPAVAFTALYNFDFKDTIVTGVLDAGSLRVETFDTFKDSSGRASYYGRGYFCLSKS